MSLEKFINIGETLEKLLRPSTYPLAIKFVKNTSEFPEKTRKIGQKLAICQAVTMSRRYGWTIGVSEEDSGCPAASLAFGWTKILDEETLARFFVEAGYLSNENIAKKFLNSLDRLEAGKYRGLVISPLTRTRIAPDVILVYGNSAQIMRLIQGVMYANGEKVKCELIGFAACTGEIIRTFNTGECQVAIPGTGHRAFAAVYDDEIVFSIPAVKADEIINGMKKQRLVKYPIPVNLPLPPTFPNL
ncbi:MAG: DUF169 domain-containing protein [Candidatus Bathyarchaeota archaeon]|nr:DUF169 domain-containing protein [Candidatus Bathyarchaeota archaeon]